MTGMMMIEENVRAREKSLLHAAKDTRLRDVSHVDEDVVRRMAVERCAEALLVKMMADETNRTAKNEEAIQGTNLDVFISFFRGEGTAIAEEIDKADGDATIDVQDELYTGQCCTRKIRDVDAQCPSSRSSPSQRQGRNQASCGWGSSCGHTP